MKINLRLSINISRRTKTTEHQPQLPTPQEPQPEGNNFAQAERAGESNRNHALNNDDRPGHYGNHISLKWQGK